MKLAVYSAFRPARDLFAFPPNLSLNGFSLQEFSGGLCQW
jgi:hypothetical protein